MNKKQREVIVDAYEQWLNCGHRADPVGFFGDMAEYFRELGKTDSKLQNELEEARREFENDEE